MAISLWCGTFADHKRLLLMAYTLRLD